jgi:Spy/CpxP family protein refolding chaperone
MLRRYVTLTMATCLTACLVASTSSAQPAGGRFGRGMGFPGGERMMLLANEKVQQELELVDEQKQQIKEISDNLRTELQGAFAGGQDLSQEEREKRRTQVREKTQEASKKLDELLLPHQTERLKQIVLQVQGPRALADEEVAQTLNLSEEQKKQLTSIQEETQRQMRELFRAGGGQDGDRQAAFAKVREAQQAASEKMLAVLTDEQRTKFEEMKGEAFEIPEELRGGGRGFGGRRPRGQQT